LSFRGDGLAAALAVIDGLAELVVKFLPSVKRGEQHKHGGERALGAILSRVQDEGDAQLRAEIAALSRFWIADGMVFGKAA
jgi:hypothetical protein